MPWIECALRVMTHFSIGAVLACAAWFLMHGGGRA